MPFKAADDYAHTVMTWASQPLPPEVVATLDVPYGDHPVQRYNVFAPRNAGKTHNAPALVFWHGGGWTNGYRDYCTFMAPHIVRMGMVLVAPSYRLVWQERMPAAPNDCMAALAHFAKHAAHYGAAADQLYLAGHSAGGHLAALTALRGTRSQPPASALPTNAIKGCLPISGIMDLHHPSPPEGSLEERVYSMVLAERDDDAVLSPICWAAGNHVPFALSCGEHDSPRVLRSNQRLYALLRLQDAPTSLHIEPQLDHFATNTCLADPAHSWYARLAAMVGPPSSLISAAPLNSP